MEYELDINGNTLTAELTPGKENTATVALGETTHELAFQRLSETCIQLRINGKQINAWAQQGKDGATVLVNGRHFKVKDLAAQAQAGTGNSAADLDAPTTVTPPMPAIVIQVPVSQGDTVAPGDTVVVVSAMKMETSLTAPYGGIVTRIGVAEGDKVMPGDILVDIEKEETV